MATVELVRWQELKKVLRALTTDGIGGKNIVRRARSSDHHPGTHEIKKWR
jgi:hypothetical protein